MPGIDDNNMLKGFMKSIGTAIIIAIFTGLFLSIILMKEATIFSSWFVDVYKPSKGFILEKAPIRIIFFGEANGQANAENITKIIDSLNKVKYHDYKFNNRINVNFESSLKGDRQRDNTKKISVQIKAGPKADDVIDAIVPVITDRK